MDKKLVGKRLKEIRKKLGLSQEEAGLSIQKGERAINSYETGERMVSVEYLHFMCIDHNVNINYVLANKGEMFIQDFKRNPSDEELLTPDFFELMKSSGFEEDENGYLKRVK